MNDEVFLMDEDRQAYWQKRGVDVRVGWWYFEVGGKIYGHFMKQHEAVVNREYILRRIETGCPNGVCE